MNRIKHAKIFKIVTRLQCGGFFSDASESLRNSNASIFFSYFRRWNSDLILSRSYNTVFLEILKQICNDAIKSIINKLPTINTICKM